MFLEVENEVSLVAGSKLSQLRCSRDGREWNTLLPSSVVTAAGSRYETLEEGEGSEGRTGYSCSSTHNVKGMDT